MTWKNNDTIDWVDDGEEVRGRSSGAPVGPDSVNSAVNRMVEDVQDNCELLKLAVDKWATSTENPKEAVSTRDVPQNVNGLKSFLKVLLAKAGIKVTKGDPLGLGSNDILAIFENSDSGHNLTMCEDADNNVCYTSGMTYSTSWTNWIQINSDDPNSVGVGLFYNNSEVGFFKVSTGDSAITKMFYINDSGEVLLGTNFYIKDGFLALEDTPANYVGQSKKILAVKENEDGIEFIDFPTQTYLALEDTPTSYGAIHEANDHVFNPYGNYEHPSYLPSYAFDANINTKWTAGNVSSGYIGFELDNPFAIGSIDVTFTIYYTDTKTFALYGSSTGDFTGEEIFLGQAQQSGGTALQVSTITISSGNIQPFKYYRINISISANTLYNTYINTLTVKLTEIDFDVKVNSNRTGLTHKLPEVNLRPFLEANYNTKTQLATSGQASIHKDNVIGLANQIEWRSYPLPKPFSSLTQYSVIQNNWRLIPRSLFECPAGKIPIVRIIAQTSSTTGYIDAATSLIAIRGNSYGSGSPYNTEELIHWDSNQGYSKTAPSVSQQMLIPTYGSPYEDLLFYISASDVWIVVLGYTT